MVAPWEVLINFNIESQETGALLGELMKAAG
jgi:hypothetical protein